MSELVSVLSTSISEPGLPTHVLRQQSSSVETNWLSLGATQRVSRLLSVVWFFGMATWAIK